MGKYPGKYSTAASRWAGGGPYYAMFPTSFADEVIGMYTKPGDSVLDPFAGRGTAVYSAATQGRHAIGIEINPLGYVYANAKLKPSDLSTITKRLYELSEIAHSYRERATSMSPFFHLCFAPTVRAFLLTVRDNLNWRQSRVDRTLMAMILISLHGKRGQSLSNQMRQVTAMAPEYSVRWWKERKLTPPDVEPVSFLAKRIKWRYKHGTPDTDNAIVYKGDSVRRLPSIARDVQEGRQPKANLLVTSPPYHNITNYYYDQWLRMWLLGNPDHPRSYGNRYGGKFSNPNRYRGLLRQVFSRAKPVLDEEAIIYVRTDQRETTLQPTLEVLAEVFPEKYTSTEIHPLKPEQQAKPYGRGGAPKQPNCEIDLVLTPR